MGEIVNPSGGNNPLLSGPPFVGGPLSAFTFQSTAAAIGSWVISQTNAGLVVQQFTAAGYLYRLSPRYFTTNATANSQHFNRINSDSANIYTDPALVPPSYGAYLSQWGFSSNIPAQFKAGARYFNGLAPTSTLTITGTYDSLQNIFGLGKDDADTVLSWVHNDNAGNITKVPISGLNYASLLDNVYNLIVGVNLDGSCSGAVFNALTGELIDRYSATSNIPITSVSLGWQCVLGNGTTAGAASHCLTWSQFFRNVEVADFL